MQPIIDFENIIDGGKPTTNNGNIFSRYANCDLVCDYEIKCIITTLLVEY